MKPTNVMGLDQKQTQKVTDKLNTLLASYAVFYQNVRGFHWNIKGYEFFELHEKFEELYTDLASKIDEVAERIVTLGYIPEHTYSTYLKNSKIEESATEHNGIKAVEHILVSFKVVMTLQRELLKQSEEAQDEGTNALMSDYIKDQEETIWMYTAFLGS